jgi:hypothetical protein
MKKLATVAACAAGFLLIAAPIYMKYGAHPLFIDNKQLGNAVDVNGTLAVSLDDFATALCGSPNPQKAGLVVQGTRIGTGIPAVQPSATPDTFTSSKSSTKTTRPTIQPFTITKRSDSATPMIVDQGKLYVPVSVIAQFFGTTFTGNADRVGPGAIRLTSVPARASIIVVH